MAITAGATIRNSQKFRIRQYRNGSRRSFCIYMELCNNRAPVIVKLVQGLMDNSILTEAYQLYYRSLYAYAYYLTGNRADAEDLVSDAFVRAILSWNETGSLRAWLFRVVKNMFIDLTRKRKRIAEVPEDYLLNLPAPDRLQAMEEERLWLFGEIRQMKRDDQELMILTLYSGLNDMEIASQLGITPDNLRVRRHRIITRLKNRAADRRTEE